MARDTEHFNDQHLTPDQIAKYQRDGYLALGRTLTDQGLEKMRDQCMAAWTREKGEFDPSQTWLQNALLPNIHHWSPIVRQYYFEGPLVDVAEQVVSSNIKAVTSQLTFKMRGNTKPFGWHQDNGYGELDPYNAISCLTALDDADETNGCLWIIPGSHKRGQIGVGHTDAKKASRNEIEIDVDETQAIPVPMRAGEAIFFHCHTLHKSEGNRSETRDRRIVFCRYADADAVEVYNQGKPRLGRLVRGETRFPEVREYEADMA